MSTKVLLVTGGGGVGKTTLSAALATTAARRGHTTLVVTVDPAKRLADALGLEHLGDDPQQIVNEPNLWGAMLDAHRSWDEIAHRYAPPDVGRRLVANPFFEAAAQHFPASQAYAAGEEMALRVESGRWDLVVVDTPPAAGGIEFFTAPSEMRSLIGGRLLRWLTGASLPGRRLLYRFTAKPALRVADIVLGSDLLEAVADFLVDLRSAYDGIARRSREIERLLKTAATIVVTTADPAPLREAARFFDVRSPQVVIFNRMLPATWYGAASPMAGAIAKNLERWGVESHRQREAMARFAARWSTRIAEVPWQAHPPTDLTSLASLIASATNLDLESLFS